VLLLLACDEHETNDQSADGVVKLQCTATSGAVSERAFSGAAVAEAARACTSDNECGAWTPSVECGRLGTPDYRVLAACSRPIRLAKRPEAEAALRADGDKLCADVPAGCQPRLACMGAVACVAGMCEFVYRDADTPP
jgi:hypothetical protein